jgi:hypothetical protein
VSPWSHWRRLPDPSISADRQHDWVIPWVIAAR